MRKTDRSKRDPEVYRWLFQYGDEKKAIQRAERWIKRHQEDGKKNPSEMSPGTTLHWLVREIREKIDSAK